MNSNCKWVYQKCMKKSVSIRTLQEHADNNRGANPTTIKSKKFLLSFIILTSVMFDYENKKRSKGIFGIAARAILSFNKFYKPTYN